MSLRQKSPYQRLANGAWYTRSAGKRPMRAKWSERTQRRPSAYLAAQVPGERLARADAIATA